MDGYPDGFEAISRTVSPASSAEFFVIKTFQREELCLNCNRTDQIRQAIKTPRDVRSAARRELMPKLSTTAIHSPCAVASFNSNSRLPISMTSEAVRRTRLKAIASIAAGFLQIGWGRGATGEIGRDLVR